MTGIWVPRVAEQRKVWQRCAVPQKHGGVCGYPIYEDEAFRSQKLAEHVRQCASDNHDHIVAAREQAHPSVMKAWDGERFRWVRENGAAILAGRVKM